MALAELIIVLIIVAIGATIIFIALSNAQKAGKFKQRKKEQKGKSKIGGNNPNKGKASNPGKNKNQ